MDIKKNHKKHFNLKSFDEVTENTYINEETGILIKFHENDYVQEKINYLIEDIIDERAPLRHQSYNNNPSEIFYDTEGGLLKLNYSEMGKLHSVGGHYLFDKKNGISYWGRVNLIWGDIPFIYKAIRTNCCPLNSFMVLSNTKAEKIGSLFIIYMGRKQ